MKIALQLVILGAAFAAGVWVDRMGRPASAPAVTAAPAPVGDPAPSTERKATVAPSAKEPATTVPVGAKADSAKVKSLLAAFDRRKPVASQLAVLQKIMTASPADLAEMAKGMSGQWRNDPGWWQTRTAVMQRWVEMAPEEALAWAKAPKKAGEYAHQGAEIFAILANIDPTRAMAEAERVTNPMLKKGAIESVMGAIAQTNPEQAFRLCETMTGDRRRNTYSTLFASWAERDPAAAAAAMATIKNPSDRRSASYSLMNRWAMDDPAAALAWAKGQGEPGMRQQSLQAYFGTVSQRDPEAAIAQIAEFPRHQQQAYYANVVGNWMQNDPDAATEWVLSRPNAIEQQKLIVGAVGQLSWMASEQAGKLVVKLAPGSAREQALKDVVGTWMWSDSDAAIAFTKELPPAERRKMSEQVVQGLAYRDPEKAMAYLKENPIDDPASYAWGQLGSSLASQGTPEKALEWANALPDEISRRRALPGIFSQMVQENPAEAAKQAAALPDEATRLECLSTVAGAWAGAGMDEALAWAKGLTGKERETAMGAVLGQGAPHQPTVAAEQFNSLMTGVPAGTKPADSLVAAAGTIAAAYFAENEQAAAQWASGLPQDDARAAAVRSLAEQWTQYDAAGASEWIGSLPGGKPRDAAVGQLVAKIASSDPASAFEWAATVVDTGERSTLLQTTFDSWRRLDASAARSAIEAAPWTDDEKAKWLDKVK